MVDLVAREGVDDEAVQALEVCFAVSADLAGDVPAAGGTVEVPAKARDACVILRVDDGELIVADRYSAIATRQGLSVFFR